MAYENIFEGRDRTLVEKILAEEDIQKLTALLKKEIIDYEDIAEINSRLVSKEIKLLNLTAWDRYLIGKLLAWLEEFSKMLLEYYKFEKQYEHQSEEMKIIIKTTKSILSDNVKFIIIIFLYLTRSTLSVNMRGFTELLKQKFEYEYIQPEPKTTEEKKFFFFKK